MAKTAFHSQWVAGRQVIVDTNLTTGNIFFVHSGTGTDATGYGRGPDKPYAGLNYAFAACTANQGDRIYLMPGHAETVATAGAIATACADVHVHGIGSGINRAIITFDGGGIVPGVDINIDHAGVCFNNIIFYNTEDAAAAPLDVNASDCRIRDCLFWDAGADNTLTWVDVAAAGDRFHMQDCLNHGTLTAGNVAFITISGACEHLHIQDCTSDGDFSAGNIILTAAATDTKIVGNFLTNVNAVDVNIEGFAACSGVVADNRCRIPTDAQTTWINTPGGWSLYNNWGVNQDGEAGMEILGNGRSA